MREINVGNLVECSAVIRCFPNLTDYDAASITETAFQKNRDSFRSTTS